MMKPLKPPVPSKRIWIIVVALGLLAGARFWRPIVSAPDSAGGGAGPTEATAIGNLCAQMIAAGELENLKEARQCVYASFPMHKYEK